MLVRLSKTKLPPYFGVNIYVENIWWGHSDAPTCWSDCEVKPESLQIHLYAEFSSWHGYLTLGNVHFVFHQYSEYTSEFLTNIYFCLQGVDLGLQKTRFTCRRFRIMATITIPYWQSHTPVRPSCRHLLPSRDLTSLFSVPVSQWDPNKHQSTNIYNDLPFQKASNNTYYAIWQGNPQEPSEISQRDGGVSGARRLFSPQNQSSRTRRDSW